MRTYTTEELSFHICAFAHLDSNNLGVKMGDHTCFESMKSFIYIPFYGAVAIYIVWTLY